MPKSTSTSTDKKEAPAVNPEFKVDSPVPDKPSFRCATGSPGQPPQPPQPWRLRVHASDGFIPLWVKNTILRYRFQERTLQRFKYPESAKADILELFGDALEEWGDAAPVRFKEDADVWDFEIVVPNKDDCTSDGCVLASAFFPDEGRHELVIYPKMFEQTRKEQIETLIHEFGHVFGLRHWFAHLEETRWPSELFGSSSPFSIMNYGKRSTLTEVDRSDLALLYQKVWSGELKEINGTPFTLFKPYSANQPRCQ